MGLSVKQVNELYIGTQLAIELKASEANLRKFLTIDGYVYNEHGHAIKPDKYLRENKINEIYFRVRSYEIPIKYYINNCNIWDVDDDLVNEIYIDDIKGIGKLELILNKYNIDYSELKPGWCCDNLV